MSSFTDRSTIISQVVCDRWLQTLVLTSVTVLLVSLVRVMGFSGRPPVNGDAAVFQHAGWYITQGAVPYVDFWDPKPPLNFELSTILAFISGGNMYLLHLLSVFATAVAAVGSVVLVGLMTWHETNEGGAALFAGATMLSLAGFHYLPGLGFRPKYFALCSGLLGLYLVVRKDPFLAGATAAAAAGFWQLAVIFPILVLLQFRQDSRSIVRAILGMLVTTVLVLLPIVAWGALVPMIAEVIVAPFVTPESQSVLFRLGKGPLVLGYTTIPVLIGLFGLGVAYKSDKRLPGWILGLGLWAAFQILFVDFDSYPDLFLGMVVASLGVGYAYTYLNGRRRRVIVTVVLTVLCLSVVLFGGAGIVTYGVEAEYYPFGMEHEIAPQDQPVLQHVIVGFGYSMRMDASNDERSENSITPATLPDMTAEMEYIYWNKVKPDRCHYRLSVMERQYMQLTGQTGAERACGRFPPHLI